MAKIRVSLRDYLQDIQNGAAFIPSTSQSEYVKAAISNLQGEVRNVVYGEQINTVADYIKHLKTRLARGKTYNYYADAISRIRMKQGQTIGESYDKIRILLSGGHAAYHAKHNTDPPAGERDPPSTVGPRFIHRRVTNEYEQGRRNARAS